MYEISIIKHLIEMGPVVISYVMPSVPLLLPCNHMTLYHMTHVHMTIQNWTFNSLYIAYTI